MMARHEGAARALMAALDDAVELLRPSADPGARPGLPVAPEASLLDQCIALCATAGRLAPEPVRTVHHFACTGGTLISKCIAAMPNVQLLSEVDPLSTLPHGPDRTKFVPTDVIGLLRRSSRGADDALLIEAFRGAMRVVYTHSLECGLRLVLRDHAHSHFCVGPAVPDRPDLRQTLPPEWPTLALVTVRHPLDSYASLKANRWVYFEPATLDEYARRYLCFLARQGGTPRVRYEDFVGEPVATMRRICEHLELPMNEGFVDLFSVFEISGDSGRSGEAIVARPRRGVSPALLDESRGSESFARLCAELGYQPEPAD